MGKITLKASVTGDSPTGSVSFAAGTTSLGTATLTNGVATLQTSFAAAGSYTVTATYKGDQNNSASTSSGVTIVIAAPDFTIAATPTSGSITPGQTATFTFTVSSCGRLRGHSEIFLRHFAQPGGLLIYSRERHAIWRLASLQHAHRHHGCCYSQA